MIYRYYSETTMEIPPGNNSFRRLLTYRVGQRFGLSHATSDQLTEVSPLSIRQHCAMLSHNMSLY